MKRYCILFVLVFIFVCAAVAQAKPKVLYIESYHIGYKWDQELSRGFKSVLKDEVELFNFQLDTKRLPVSEYSERADLAWRYYLDVNPDLVVLSDDNAMKLLSGRFSKTDTPVVYMGINDNPRIYSRLGNNITGVLERPLYKRTVKYLKELLNLDDGKVLILLDEGTTSEVFKEVVFKDRKSLLISGIKTDVWSCSDYSEWQKAVKNARKNGYKAIIVGLYHRLFDDGVNIDGEKVLSWTSENSPVPIFAFWEMSVGRGRAVGGMVLSGEVQGQAAGKIVLQILHGKPIGTLNPIIPTQGAFVFSRSELDRWKILLPRYIKRQARILE
ncbi:ABC transporter substrate binding protein [Maridesulfovibrio sp.]|uniref:ABC transporter substrate-binding protein n=1 Tax=Maridesulfovibrio sp. TaxID=2795000 RepID=UPI0029CA2EC3|nr:ABC transporter substrate binding protein [Maridesulfovibrio sp.]